MNNSEDKKERRVTANAFETQTTNQSDLKDTSDDTAPQKDNNNEKTDNSTKISGYALRFNQPSRNLGDFYEVISPTALDNCDLSNVFLLVDHNFSKPLASVTAKTLALNVDDTGLHFDATLNDTTTASDTIKDIQSGNLPDMSFGMVVGEDEFSIDDQGNTVRTITAIEKLTDIDVCAVGAYSSNGNLVKVDERSFNKWSKEQENKKEKEKSMTEKTVFKGQKMNHDEIETRSLMKYLMNGEKRDLEGITEDENAKIVIPESILNILDLGNKKPVLSDYVSKIKVSTPSGVVPVLGSVNGVLEKHEELEEVKPIKDNPFVKVSYQVATFLGKLLISNETLHDEPNAFKQALQKALRLYVLNTENANIVKVLTGSDVTGKANFTTETASDLDALKKIKNTMLDPDLNLQIICNQSIFAWLDGLKDKEDNYLLEKDISLASGKRLFGMPLIEVKDSLLPTDKGLFIGQLETSVAEFYREGIEINYLDNNYYATAYDAGLRADWRKIDSNSGLLVKIDGVDASTSSTGSNSGAGKADSTGKGN